MLFLASVALSIQLPRAAVPKYNKEPKCHVANGGGYAYLAYMRTRALSKYVISFATTW